MKYEYERKNKISKEIKLCTLFLIINVIMLQSLKSNNIIKYFGDCTYHCISPSVRKYKLFVIMGLNLKANKAHICYYCLLPDETYKSYNRLFKTLKNVYKYNLKIFTIDFCKACSKAIHDNCPDCLIIKCFFHWNKVLWTNIKKLGFTEINKINRTKELLYNIKLMAFL